MLAKTTFQEQPSGTVKLSTFMYVTDI